MPSFKHWDKCGRILGMSNVMSLGSKSKTMHVEKAIAKIPQSLPFCCCCTGILVISTLLSAIKLSTCSLTSLSMISWERLSKRLTTLGWHPTELIHIQWECPVCNICTNSPAMISKFRTGPRVGLWKPSMIGLTFCKNAWACWIIVQSSQPVGERMVSKWLSERLPRDACLLVSPSASFVISMSLSLAQFPILSLLFFFLTFFFYFHLKHKY